MFVAGAQHHFRTASVRECREKSDTRLLSKCSGQLALQCNYQVRFGRIGAADKIVGEQRNEE
jgi:hypothetical protein